MKKRILNTLMLTLSITPLMQAMSNEKLSIIAKKNNQDLFQQIRHDVTQDMIHSGKKAILRSVASGWMALGNSAAHEGGQALIASLIKPGCVEEIHVELNGGYCRFNRNGMSTPEQMAVFAAGPVAGAVFSYVTIKGLQALDAYLKKRDFKTALTTARMQPIRTPSDSPSIEMVKKAADNMIRKNIASCTTLMPGIDDDKSFKVLLSWAYDTLTKRSYAQYQKEHPIVVEEKNVSYNNENLIPPAYGKIYNTLKRLLLT